MTCLLVLLFSTEMFLGEHFNHLCEFDGKAYLDISFSKIQQDFVWVEI